MASGSSSKESRRQKGSSKASVIVPIPTLVPASRFLTGGRLPGQLIPLARAGQAYRLRRRRAGMSKPAIFPNWPAGQRGYQEFFRIIFIRFTPNPHDLRAIGHQNDTGRDQAAYRGAGSFRRNNSSPSTAVGKSPVPGVRCAISLDSSPSSISTDLSGIIL